MAVQETRTRPAQFVEDLGVDLAEQVVAQSGVPVVSTGLAGLGSMAQPTKQSFETDEQFKRRQDLFGAQQRAALGFEQRQQALSGLAPQIAGLTAREQEARKIADAGIGAFRPFIRDAQTLTGAGAGTGAGSVQQFMSPYQQQVIDTSLAEFDRQKAIQEQRIRDQAVASGAFGGGREGVQLAEFQAGSDRNRLALEAGLRQQGFGQAMQARQQDIANRFGVAEAQRGLGAFQSGLGGQQQALAGTDITRLGQLGALNQAQVQAQLDAQREAVRQATFQPQEQLDLFANRVTGLMGGVQGQGTQTTNIPNPTPLQTALGVGTTLAGIYGGLTGKGNFNFSPRIG